MCFLHDISKTARITKLYVETYHHESWKPIYFGFRRSVLKVTRHKHSAIMGSCTLVRADFFLYVNVIRLVCLSIRPIVALLSDVSLFSTIILIVTPRHYTSAMCALALCLKVKSQCSIIMAKVVIAQTVPLLARYMLSSCVLLSICRPVWAQGNHPFSLMKLSRGHSQ